MSANTPLPNGFTINRLGLNGGSVPFPFTLSCSQAAPGIYTLSLTPLRVIDMCDLLGRYQAVVVYGVDGSFPFDHATSVPLTLDKVASDRAAIDHRTVDAHTLIVTADALYDLLDWVPHYNLHAFDWQADQTEYDLITNVLETSDHDLHRAGPVLPRLIKARLFLDSHDDCYLSLESRDLPLLKAVFGRALRIYAGTVLAQDIQFEGEIAEVPETVVDRAWPEDSALTMLRRETIVAGSKVRIPASTREFDFRHDQPYPPAFLIEYDFVSGNWKVHS